MKVGVFGRWPTSGRLASRVLWMAVQSAAVDKKRTRNSLARAGNAKAIGHILEMLRSVKCLRLVHLMRTSSATSPASCSTSTLIVLPSKPRRRLTVR